MKKIRVLLFMLSLVLAGIQGHAQTLLSGRVTDAYTGQPVDHVTIYAGKTDRAFYSDAAGRFEFPADTTGQPLMISHLAYQSLTYQYDGKSAFIYVELVPKDLQLDEVVVTGYQSERRLLETAGAITKLSSQELQRHDPASLLNALSTVPGVRMESRGTAGSSRLSVRGSSLRSPFGIRNLKVYWNDIPLTSPDGSTPLEVIDMGAISDIEVIKGTAGSLYGAGTGGVVLFKTRRKQQNEISVRALAGSYGLNRETVSATVASAGFSLSLDYIRHRLSGYRQQEAVYKDFINLQAAFYPDQKRNISVYAYHQRGGWELPGSLTREQAVANPRQAVPYSVDANASLQRRRTSFGLSQQYNWNSHLWNVTTVFGNFTEKENPYGTSRAFNGYKVEGAQGNGLRTQFVYRISGSKLATTFTAGTELQTELNTLREYENRNGKPGILKENGDTRTSMSSVFVQGELELPFQIILSAGLSYNRMEYRYRDLFTADTLDLSVTRHFDPAWSPRVAAVKKLGDHLSVHGSISSGFSPPALWDVRSSGGRINTALDAERGTNFEAGMRGSIRKFNFDVTAFSFRLKDAILPRTLADGATVFYNSGMTYQKGIEAALSFMAVDDSKQRVSFLKPWLSLALNRYRFGHYESAGRNFRGNALTGMPSHTLVAGLDVAGRQGWYGYFTVNHTGRIPLNDANTAFQSPYTFAELKTGYRKTLFNRLKLDVFAGINNLFNERYTSFLQVNDARERYFNPAPGRNYYAGVGISYQ